MSFLHRVARYGKKLTYPEGAECRAPFHANEPVKVIGVLIRLAPWRFSRHIQSGKRPIRRYILSCLGMPPDLTGVGRCYLEKGHLAGWMDGLHCVNKDVKYIIFIPLAINNYLYCYIL